MSRARILQFVVTASCIGLLVWLADLGEVLTVLRSANPVWLSVAILVAFADRALMVGKWLPLVKIQLPDISTSIAARAYLGSGIGLYALPSFVGADGLRALALGRGRGAVPLVSASIAAERLLGLLASSVVALVAVGVGITEGLDLLVLVPWAALAVAAALISLLASLHDRVHRWFDKLSVARFLDPVKKFVRKTGRGYTRYRKEKGLLALVGALSCVEQLLPVLIGWLIALALGVPASIVAFLVAAPLAALVSRLPISLGGLGVHEGALVYVLNLFGISTAEALTISLVGRAIDVCVVLGLASVFSKDLVKAATASNSATDEGS